MAGKKDKQFLFEVQLNWLADKKGILSAKDAPGTLHVPALCIYPAFDSYHHDRKTGDCRGAHEIV